jgi:hypothetical protein
MNKPKPGWIGLAVRDLNCPLCQFHECERTADSAHVCVSLRLARAAVRKTVFGLPQCLQFCFRDTPVLIGIEAIELRDGEFVAGKLAVADLVALLDGVSESTA